MNDYTVYYRPGGRLNDIVLPEIEISQFYLIIVLVPTIYCI